MASGRIKPKVKIGTEAELRAYVETTFGVKLPDVQVCPNHTTPWRAFADAYFAKYPVTVWKGSRGFGGKSFTLALLGLTEAVTLGANVNIIGGSGEQSKRVHAYQDQWWALSTAPRDLLIETPTQTITRLTMGNMITALTASSRSVRGPHPQRLRMDEVDEMDLSIFNAAMGQPMSSRGVRKQVVLSSTHQYPDGTMTEVMSRAAENGWPVYDWCYRETLEPHGWLAQSEVDSKRGEVTAAMWQTEYDLQEPTSESRAIVPEKVDAMFRSEMGVYSGRPGEYIEIEPPIAGAWYATGTDWGKDRDWTIIVTLRCDVRPARLVAFERRGREPWPTMVSRQDDRIKRFPGKACHDATGLGDVVDDYKTQAATDVKLVGLERADTFNKWIGAIEHGGVEAPLITYMKTEHKNASRAALFGAGHPPDTFVAGALAWKAATMIGITDEELNAYRQSSGLPGVPVPKALPQPQPGDLAAVEQAGVMPDEGELEDDLMYYLQRSGVKGR